MRANRPAQRRRAAVTVTLLGALLVCTLALRPRLQAAVRLSEFSATYTVDGNVRVTWKTVAETDTVGFYIMRATSENGFPPVGERDFIPVRPLGSDQQVEFIPGSGGQIGNFEYTVFDEDPTLVTGQRYWYKLVEEERDGRLLTYSIGIDDVLFGATDVADPQVTPGTLNGAARPGANMTYTLTLTNAGNATDAYRISVEEATWPVSTQPPLLVSQLPPGGSTTIRVLVTVPADAVPDSADSIIVRVRSLEIDAEVSTTASIVTVAQHMQLLPVVYRDAGGR